MRNKQFIRFTRIIIPLMVEIKGRSVKVIVRLLEKNVKERKRADHSHKIYIIESKYINKFTYLYLNKYNGVLSVIYFSDNIYVCF